MRKEKIIAARILLAIYLITVAFLCFWRFNNVSSIEKLIFGIPFDKVVHFFMFLPFPFLGYAAVGRKFDRPGKTILFILGLFLLGCAVAATTEIVQGSLPYRTADPKDFRADAIALAISSLIVFIWDLFRKV